MSPQVPAVSRAAAILRFLSASAVPVSATRIAEAVGAPRSSTYHLLSALQAEGFVMHLPDERRYLLGLAAAELGSTYSQQASLSLQGYPLMAQLVRRVRYPVHLGLLHGREVLYIVEQRPPRSQALVTEPQVQLPAHITASGRAMLALLPPSQVTALFTAPRAFAGRTGAGPKSLPALRRVLSDERTQGFAVENEEVTIGMSSVAVACLDRHGRPAASIAMTFPASRSESPLVRWKHCGVRRTNCRSGSVSPAPNDHAFLGRLFLVTPAFSLSCLDRCDKEKVAVTRSEVRGAIGDDGSAPEVTSGRRWTGHPATCQQPGDANGG